MRIEARLQVIALEPSAEDPFSLPQFLRRVFCHAGHLCPEVIPAPALYRRYPVPDAHCFLVRPDAAGLVML